MLVIAVFVVVPQIEELYSEILYEILHIVGCDAAAEEERAPLFCYLQEAFKLDYEKHNQLLEMARAKEVIVKSTCGCFIVLVATKGL